MSEQKIFEAISKVMADVGAVGKNDKNPQQGYKYRSIDKVMNALNPALIKHNVFVTPEVLEQTREERNTSKGGVLIYSVCKVKYTFYTTDGSSVTAIVIGEAMDSGDKATNKAMSAAFKYACFQTFCIPTEEMIDTERDSHGGTIENPEISPKDKDLIPHGEPVTMERLEKLLAELERTGVPEQKIMDAYKLKDLRDLTEAQYISAMNRLEKTADKK